MVQVIEFWKSMEWPDHTSGVSFVSKITEDLCRGATYYADLIHEKLQAAGYYDETGQFDVTEEVLHSVSDYISIFVISSPFFTKSTA